MIPSDGRESTMKCDETILWLEVSPPPRDLNWVDHQFSLQTADNRPVLINSAIEFRSLSQFLIPRSHFRMKTKVRTLRPGVLSIPCPNLSNCACEILSLVPTSTLQAEPIDKRQNGWKSWLSVGGLAEFSLHYSLLGSCSELFSVYSL